MITDLVPTGPSAITPQADDVMQYLAHFLRLNVAEGDASERTIKAYMTHIRQFYQWSTKQGIDAGMATEEDIATYRRYLVTQEYKRSSIGVKLSALRRFFLAAIWRGLRTDNPAEGVRPPRDHTTRRDKILERYLTAEDIVALLGAPNRSTDSGVRDWAMLGIMYFHGLRVSEVSGLEIADVRLDASQLVIRGAKGGKDRINGLVSTTKAMLSAWLIVRSRLLLGKQDTQTLFLSFSRRNLHGALSTDGIKDIVDHYLMATSLKRPGVSCHALRHSHATHCIEAGGSLTVLSQEMGHASIDTTSVYIHAANAIEQNPAARLEEKLRSTQESL